MYSKSLDNGMSAGRRQRARQGVMGLMGNDMKHKYSSTSIFRGNNLIFIVFAVVCILLLVGIGILSTLRSKNEVRFNMTNRPSLLLLFCLSQ